MPNVRSVEQRVSMNRLLGGLKAVAEPTRLRILSLCAHAELTVSDLTQILGQSQPRVSRHLKLLTEAGLLDRFREGAFALYRLAGDGASAELAATVADLVPLDDPLSQRDLARLEAMKAVRAQAAVEYFRANAGQWDVIRRMHVADSEVEQAILDCLPSGPLGDVVDLGTGTGRMLELVAGRASRLVGIDRSREMLAIARAKLERTDATGWQVRHGDVHSLPLADESFDVALVHQVLHFLRDPEDALVEAARVLRPGGLLIVVDFARHEVEGLRDEHAHVWLGFADQEVASWLAKAGLSCRSIEHLAGDPLTVTLWSADRGQRRPLERRPPSARLREAS
jgi:ubiquinone/menaquinone biosynthesis C-methylase UbiE